MRGRARRCFFVSIRLAYNVMYTLYDARAAWNGRGLVWAQGLRWTSAAIGQGMWCSVIAESYLSISRVCGFVRGDRFYPIEDYFYRVNSARVF